MPAGQTDEPHIAAVVFKICTSQAWRDAERSGHFSGSADDLRDGFIHLSTADQLQGTAERHFKDQPDLVLVAINSSELGDHLVWEPSRGGQLFPHLYAALPVASAISVQTLSLNGDGIPVIPKDI